jgi:hypothetical protein
MDDELQQLEAELKRLRPSAPSLRVNVGIRTALTVAPAQAGQPRASRLYWWWAAALPAAAALTLTLVYFSSSRVARSSRPGLVQGASPSAGQSRPAGDLPLKPVAAEKLLISASDEGLVTLDDGTQARRERFRFVDTITWKNPRTNASLTWSVPREEVRVVPVVFQ